MTPLEFANKNLFEPLGISGAKWLADPQGINNGSGLMYLTARDMAKIGYLYLNNGNGTANRSSRKSTCSLRPNT